tara:strand:- start:30145 stop:30990 length:846 start_codon:yes stop_codon:yes gene_type:complete
MLKFLVILFLVLFVQNETIAQRNAELSILSWNVFLRPAILNDGQLDRVDSIVKYLENSNADILVLQEVFHKKARRKLTKQLKKEYYYSTKMGKKSFWGISSGVVIFSKHKILKEKHVAFKSATGSDKMARKGGVSSIIEFFNTKIQIIGTHLQAGKGPKRENIRKKQLRKLKSIEDTTVVASIYAGDFNIENSTIPFGQMIESLNCDNINTSGILKKTSNFSDQKLYPTTGKAKWIDFILLRKNKNSKLKKSRIEEPKSKIKGRLSRLSDHNPIISTVVLL